ELEQAHQIYRNYPLAEILRGQGVSKLFDVLFNFTNFHIYGSIESELNNVNHAEIFEETNFSLIVGAHINYTDLAGVMSFAYRDDRFDEFTIQRLSDCFLQYLTTILKCSADSCTAHRILPAGDERLLEEWNATASEYPQDKCLHELFAEQAGRTPDAIAVV